MATIAYITILLLLGIISLLIAFFVEPLPEAPKQILIAIGTTLVSTAAVSMFFESVMRAGHQRALADLMNKSLRQSMDLYSAAAREGITGIFPNREA